MTDVAAVVAAAAGSRGIGFQGKLPWRLPGDMSHFKQVTKTPPSPGLTNAVIMGRKTWDSIPPKFRPLDGRVNVVLSRQGVVDGASNGDENVVVATSLDEAMEKLKSRSNHGSTFIIGGGEIYSQAIKSGLVKRVVYTNVKGLPEDAEFDAFFPELCNSEWDCVPFLASSFENKSIDERVAKRAKAAEEHVDAKSGLRYQFLEYIRRDNSDTANKMKSEVVAAEVSDATSSDAIPEGPDINPEEIQYLNICRDIIENGVKRGDRTGTGTLSKFGVQMRFSLRDGTLPLLTTKRTFWRGVAEELLWFVKGSTNANELAEKKIHIWDGNGSREFLDSRGLQHREQGDLGPVYGFQWRHFGAEYEDMHTDYTGKGVDQLADCIEKIKNNPEDRRIIMSAWNPKDLDLMALPPCHMFCQFYVDTEKNELSCQMYQRSADMGLGVPFNIASYALLTHMIAKVTGRKPGEFVHTIGDAHVYLNHVDALKEQLKRSPRAFPKLSIKEDKTDIDSFEYDDFEVLGYNPHGAIKMKMAV